MIYTKVASRKIAVLEKKLATVQAQRAKLKKEEDLLEKQISDVMAQQSPIKPGDIIQWESGSRIKRGRVIGVEVACRWRGGEGYTYRTHIITKGGKEVGYAAVHSDRMPEKVS